MADNPVAWGQATAWPRGTDGELLAELYDLISRVDGIPDGVLEAARSAGPPRPECTDVLELAGRLMLVEPLEVHLGPTLGVRNR
jgi:hypothetical protein